MRRTTAAALIFSGLGAGVALGQNLLTNGDFSSGNTGFTSGYTYATGSSALSAGGEGSGEGNYAITTSPNNVHSGLANYGDHTTGSGKMMVINGSGNASNIIWEENVTSLAVGGVTGSTYTFSGWISSAIATSAATLQVTINGANVGSVITAPAAAGVWQQFTVTWTRGAATSADIRLTDTNTAANGNDFALDDLRLVPEPSTYAAGIFLAGAGFLAWRKSRQAAVTKA